AHHAERGSPLSNVDDVRRQIVGPNQVDRSLEAVGPEAQSLKIEPQRPLPRPIGVEPQTAKTAGDGSVAHGLQGLRGEASAAMRRKDVEARHSDESGAEHHGPDRQRTHSGAGIAKPEAPLVLPEKWIGD